MASSAGAGGGAASSSTERGKAFVQVLSCVLSRLVAANDPVADPGPVTKFHALRPPSISILDYCARIHKYASCSPECFVLALVYIDRLIQRNSLLLTSLNVHRIIITAVMLAAKFFDDQYFNNAYYAKVGGVPTSEVNALELEFLFSINFSLHVPTDVYEKYYAELANHMGVGVPPELMTGNTCDCSRFAPAIGYAPAELANTGMRSLDEMASESLAAFAEQQYMASMHEGATAGGDGGVDAGGYAMATGGGSMGSSQAGAYGGGGDGDATMAGAVETSAGSVTAAASGGGGGMRSSHHASMDVDASYSGGYTSAASASACCAPIAAVPAHMHCPSSSSSSSSSPSSAGFSGSCASSAGRTRSHWQTEGGPSGPSSYGASDGFIRETWATGVPSGVNSSGITSGPGRSFGARNAFADCAYSTGSSGGGVGSSHEHERDAGGRRVLFSGCTSYGGGDGSTSGCSSGDSRWPGR